MRSTIYTRVVRLAARRRAGSFYDSRARSGTRGSPVVTGIGCRRRFVRGICPDNESIMRIRGY